MSKLKKIIIFLAFFIVILSGTVYGFLYYKLSKIYDSNMESPELESLDYNYKEGITNILLIGTDARPDEEKSRSDSVMILTIDSKHGSVKLTSLARDSYVDIPGHEKQKLAHANAYGGSDLLIETIEQNFELDINYYATVNFESFMYIIETLGGVEVDVQNSYIKEMNKFIPEAYGWYKGNKKDSIQYISKSGVQKLNGYQALTFTRIRHNDSAFERDKRQREVMESIINSVKDLPITKYPQLLNSVVPFIKTNMKPNEILGLGAEVLRIGNYNVKQFEFPIDDDKHSIGGIYGNSGWVLRFEKSSLNILHDFIFKDKEYETSNS